MLITALTACSDDNTSDTIPTSLIENSRDALYVDNLVVLQDASSGEIGVPNLASAIAIEQPPATSTAINSAASNPASIVEQASQLTQSATELDTGVADTNAPPTLATQPTSSSTDNTESQILVPDPAASDSNGDSTAPITPITSEVQTEPEASAAIAGESAPTEPLNSTGTTDVDQPNVISNTFISHTDSTFSGRILANEQIEVSWQPFPTAVGYNVYRDSEYYTTVTAPRFIDTNTDGADAYYYEIEAFDEPRNFTDIADGLTVRLRETSVSLPPQIASGYDLVFADEFNGNTLDQTRWSTSYIWGTDIIINEELQYYVDINNQPDFPFNPFVVHNGYLEIKSVPTPDELKTRAQNQPYLSGVITSYESYKFTYGYVEARLKLPKGRGFWSAFWLLNAYYDKNKPEIDIMEHLGHNLDLVFHTYHYYDTNEVLHSTESEGSRGVDFTGDFHVFAVEWRPGTIIYYIDGVERHRVSDINVSNEEMYIIANTAVGGWWPGSPDQTTSFPASYKIDYIRAYQKRGNLDPLPQFDDTTTTLKPATELTRRSPNHLPPYELWPEGYPTRQ